MMRPELSAGVPGSMADTTTGRDPWILKPNSPSVLGTVTVLLHSKEENALLFNSIQCSTFNKVELHSQALNIFFICLDNLYFYVCKASW